MGKRYIFTMCRRQVIQMPENKGNKVSLTKAVKVPPALHKLIDKESANTGIPMYRLVERAWSEYVRLAAEPSQATVQPPKSPSGEVNRVGTLSFDMLRRIGQLADEIKELARDLSSGESGANQEGSGGREGGSPAGSIAAAAVERARAIRDRAPGGKDYSGGAEGGVRATGADTGKRKKKAG